MERGEWDLGLHLSQLSQRRGASLDAQRRARHKITRTSTKPVTWVFKICEAASTICSNEVTVVFTGSPTNATPVADFTLGCAGLSWSFTDRSTDADGNVTAWRWSFGDGGTSTTRNPGHLYAAEGSYSVGLTVTDNAGAPHSRSASVTVTASASMVLTATGREADGKQYMTLRWTGVVGPTVDIQRRGTGGHRYGE